MYTFQLTNKVYLKYITILIKTKLNYNHIAINITITPKTEYRDYKMFIMVRLRHGLHHETA